MSNRIQQPSRDEGLGAVFPTVLQRVVPLSRLALVSESPIQDERKCGRCAIRDRRRIVGLLLLLGYAAGVAAWLGGRAGWFGRWGSNSAERHAAHARELCSTCHEFPPPDTLPAPSWKPTIKRMYQIAEADVPWPPDKLPPMAQMVDYYTTSAPPSFLVLPPSAPLFGSPIAFQPEAVAVNGIGPFPATSHVSFEHLLRDEPAGLLVCDMRYGFVGLLPLKDTSPTLRVLGNVSHPAQAQVVDWDGDGIRDVLVACLGTMKVTDEKNGSVVWLRGNREGGFQTIPLITKLGRVSDVRAADFDGDGDLDLVVAVFGYRKLGCVLYLENVTDDYSDPQLEPWVLDGRPGPSHVPIVDLNHDGLPDFVALISQQFETVIAFLNIGNGRFEKRKIFAAPHPNWGCASIEMVDLDRDGDWDILLTHGDTLDDLVPKPYNGISWLENRGEYPFVYHPISQLHGAYGARTGDLDGDGDLDIAACSFLPYINPALKGTEILDSIIWLEQTKPMRFQRHVLETACCLHAVMALGDYNADGRPDIVVGNFTDPAAAPDFPFHPLVVMQHP